MHDSLTCASCGHPMRYDVNILLPKSNVQRRYFSEPNTDRGCRHTYEIRHNWTATARSRECSKRDPWRRRPRIRPRNRFFAVDVEYIRSQHLVCTQAFISVLRRAQRRHVSRIVCSGFCLRLGCQRQQEREVIDIAGAILAEHSTVLAVDRHKAGSRRGGISRRVGYFQRVEELLRHGYAAAPETVTTRSV